MSTFCIRRRQWRKRGRSTCILPQASGSPNLHNVLHLIRSIYRILGMD